MGKDDKQRAERLRRNLKYIYGEKIEIRVGTSENSSFDIKEKAAIADLVVYLRCDLNAGIVWNQRYRRDCGGMSHCFEWRHPIDGDGLSKGFISVESRKFVGSNGLESEFVLMLSFETLYENMYELFTLVQNADESALDNDIVNDRTKKTVERYNRDIRFRNMVLEAYGSQCAVCGCREEKLLQAAHIRAVADGGSDDVSNGICLCANHHLMFDKALIQIDFKNKKLLFVADSVKKMPWYDAFLKKGGVLFIPKEER